MTQKILGYVSFVAVAMHMLVYGFIGVSLVQCVADLNVFVGVEACCWRWAIMAMHHT
jgi:hypothetical protein